MPMTDQEIFDKVAIHLLTQGERSLLCDTVSGLNRCRYRGADGMQCAVGCLITDEAYHPDLEGNGATFSAVVAALQASGVLSTEKPAPGSGYTTTERLLDSLQGVHDGNSPYNWGAALLDTANEFKLGTSVLDAFNAAEMRAKDAP